MGRKVTDYEVFKDNPFQQGLRGKVRVALNKPSGWGVRVHDDDAVGYSLRKDSKDAFLVKDSEMFTKLYTPVLYEIRKLPTPGVKMLSYVLYLAKKDNDVVHISTDLAKDWCEYDSSSNVYLGIAALLEHNFICRKIGGTGEYFINVNYFFNGQRTTLDYGFNLLQKALKANKIKGDDKEE